MSGPKHIDDIETPAVLVDIDRVESNLGRAQAYANRHRLRMRPHIKTHKLPVLARRQVALGAVGITCQKLSEAEVMADGGLTDIFLPYNILGRPKLQRLLALSRRIAVSVSADSLATLSGYDETFSAVGEKLNVLVECDTGGQRCGVQSPAEAAALAAEICGRTGVSFAGLATYPGAGKVHATAAWLEEAVALLSSRGIPCATISNGGTPDLWSAHEVTAASEHRAGTYIYLDRYQVAKGVGSFDDCALTVLSTVVSHPTRDRIVLDAGSKALTSDTLGMNGFGLISGYEEIPITILSEEHAVADATHSTTKPSVGDRVRIVPNHACPVSNLFDFVHFVRGDEVSDIVPVAARGCVT